MKKDNDEVAIFWDFENCPAPTNISGYDIVNNIRSIAQNFGSVTLFKAYFKLEITEQVPMPKALLLRSELQSSGVSLTDCPHNGGKDVADNMIIVDMLAHAIDNPAPSTIVLISGDPNFAYALSILRLRRYPIVLITLSNAHPGLRVQASVSFDWNSDILEPVDPTLSHQLTSPRHAKTSASPAHIRSYSDIKSYNALRPPCQESYGEKSPSSVEFINYFQDKTKCNEISRTRKHDATHDFLSLDLEKSERLHVPSVASSAIRSVPSSPARVVPSPVASSCHTNVNDSIKTPLIMASHDSKSSQTTPTPNTSTGSTPNLAPYGSIMASKFSAHLRDSSLPNLVQHKVQASLMKFGSFESAIQTPTKPDLRGSSPSSYTAETPSLSSVDYIDDHDGDPSLPLAHLDVPPPPNVTAPLSAPTPSFVPSPSSPQQSAYSAETQSLSTVDNTDDPDGGPSSPPSSLAHSEIPLPPNVTAPSSASRLSSTPPSTLSRATLPAVAQSPVKTATSLQCTPPLLIPDEFKILVLCLKSHRSKGNLRPLRSVISLEIGKNGTIYRQAGVSKFREYVAMADQAGIIELGGLDGAAWIALREPWFDVSLSASTQPFTPFSSLGHATVSASTQPFTPSSSLGHATVSASTQPFTPSSSLGHATVSAASLLQPTSPPVIPNKFKVLVQSLQSYRSKGILRPPRFNLLLELAQNGPPYRQAGVSKFSEYVELAEKAGIVELGGLDGTSWIALTEPWFNALPSITSTPPSSLGRTTVSAATLLQPSSPPPPAVPEKFKILVQSLESHRSKGNFRPLRSKIGLEIANNGTTYLQAGVLKFSEYVVMAERAGIVELGGFGGTMWVGLKEPWCSASLS